MTRTATVPALDDIDGILLIGEVTALVRLSPSTLYAMVRAGTFPPMRRVGANRVGWLRSEVTAWLRELPAAEPKHCNIPDEARGGLTRRTKATATAGGA